MVADRLKVAGDFEALVAFKPDTGEVALKNGNPPLIFPEARRLGNGRLI
jgi:hypothetical protein